VVSYGGPELALLSAGLSAVAHSIGIPVFVAGGGSDAKVSDAQTAAEAAFSLLMAGLSGANLVHGMGLLESGLASSLEMLVMDNDIVGMIQVILGGIDVSDETMAVDVVDLVGPGGHYLGEDHTMQHFRDFWRSSLIDRLRYDGWVDAGATSMGDKIKTKLEGILADHQVAELSAEVLQEIKAVVGREDARASVVS
jgi:trimethylamine---corrinoid protein Co-methyltransferase